MSLSLQEFQEFWTEEELKKRSVVIARCALRFIPMLHGSLLLNTDNKVALEKRFLISFWQCAALLSSQYVSKSSSEKILESSTKIYLQLGNAPLIETLDNIRNLHDYQLTEILISSFARFSSAYSPDTADFQLLYTVLSKYDRLLGEVEKDIHVLETRGLLTVTNSRLWVTGETPNGFKNAWSALEVYLKTRDSNWYVWTDWYAARLSGRPLVTKLEIGSDPKNGMYGRSTFPAEDYLDPNSVNMKIHKVLENFAKENSVDDVQALADATPLAESIKLNAYGKFDVEFLPLQNIYKQNLLRVNEAINDCVAANAFHSDSDEIVFIQEVIEKHSDNPQRIHDDFNFVGDQLRRLISRDVVDDGFKVNRLVNSLELAARDIFANETRVREAVDARNLITKEVESEEVDLAKIINDTEYQLVIDILAERLAFDWTIDLKILLKGAIGSDRSAVIYRMLSRLTRIYLSINREIGYQANVELAKISLVNAYPHVEMMISGLKAYL